jgi:hypothetical protein
MSESTERVRVRLRQLLTGRRPEIEQAVLTRVFDVSEPGETIDPEYAEALRAAVLAAIDYALEAVELGEERAPPVPPLLLSQTRLSARSGISLDTVLRRYFAGYILLGDHVFREAEEAGLLTGPALQQILRSQAGIFGRLVAAIGDEYAREAGARSNSLQQRWVERVKGLLAGELLDSVELSYNFDAHHLGAVVVGSGAEDLVRELARRLDHRLLLVHPSDATVWAWLGAREPFDTDDVVTALSAALPVGVSVSLGEGGSGLEGWRLTHRQAKAAAPIAVRRDASVTRYRDVALLASMLQDEVLVSSLWELYLAPLAADGERGSVLRDTLRAYLGVERNASSAAAALGVTRHTVANRLSAIEERLGQPLGSCASEVEAALMLEDIGRPLAASSP